MTDKPDWAKMGYIQPGALPMGHAATTAVIDREARAMIVALQAQLDAVHARLDALEKARGAEPVLCECGHERGWHAPHGCEALANETPMVLCQCKSWRPVPQVTP